MFDYIYRDTCWNKHYIIDGKDFDTAGQAGMYLRSCGFSFQDTVDYIKQLKER